MKRFAFLLYGLVSYLIFFGTILYAIGFIGNFVVPKTIDGGAEIPILQALLNNAILLLLFAVPHSVMARPAFKKGWTKIISPIIERSTYVLISSLLLILVMWKWEPMGGIIWAVEDGFLLGIIYATFGLGWIVLFMSTFLINHFDLFGLRQVWLNFRKKEYTNLPFDTPFLYKLVRHPLYLGFIMAFWSATTMTVAHLVFAIACTAYILVGIQLEERDLLNHFGEQYLKYKKRVPMLFPFTKKKTKTEAEPILEPQEA